MIQHIIRFFYNVLCIHYNASRMPLYINTGFIESVTLFLHDLTHTNEFCWYKLIHIGCFSDVKEYFFFN